MPRREHPDGNHRHTTITVEDGVITLRVPDLRPAPQGAETSDAVDDEVIDLTPFDDEAATAAVLATHPKRVVRAYRSGLDAQAARRAPGARNPLGLHVDHRA